MFPANLSFPDLSIPKPPANGYIGYAYEPGSGNKVLQISNALDIVWTNPEENTFNAPFNIQGVNIYRSYDSEVGPWEKITPLPITVGYYRDETVNVLEEEDVSNKFLYRGNSPDKEWVFETTYRMVKNNREVTLANTSSDVSIFIDGVEVPAAYVNGFDRIVKLIKTEYLDKVTHKPVPPVLPKEDSVVICKYLRNTNNISLKSGRRIYYKLTTVAQEGESPLEHSQPISLFNQEGWDYIWKEATRRNLWILQQGGEDVQVYLRKWFGEICECVSEMRQRGREDCSTCFGAGKVGGYIGPFKYLIAPVDAQYQLRRTEQGLQPSRTGTHWTNLMPRLNTFDLIFRKNGEVLEVGYVYNAEVRGNSNLQQEFNASLISRERFISRLPFTKKQDEFLVTDKSTIPDGQEVKGRSVTFEDIMY